MRAVRGRQPLAVGLEVGVDHRQPGRRRGRVLRLLGEPAGRVEVGQRQVVAADQGPDECAARSAKGDSELGQQPLGVEQGAGLEDAMRRAPLVLGQRAELGICPASAASRAGDSPSVRIASCRITHRGEVVHQAELIQPLVDRRRHRGVVANRVRPSRQAKLLQERGELGSCEGLRRRGELGRVTAVVRTGAEVMLEEHFGLLSRAAAHQDMALIGAEQDGDLQRRTSTLSGRGIVEQLVARGEPQLIAGGDQDRLADQLALQDRLARPLDVFQLPTRFRAPEHDHRVGVTPLADAEGHERSACLGLVRGDGDRPDLGRRRGRAGGAASRLHWNHRQGLRPDHVVVAAGSR